MQRFRKIKKYGNSHFISLKPIDLIDLGLKEGDYIDISDVVVISDALFEIKFKTKLKEVKQNG
jgi:antitoxin component of MazEF toxin-antitoxin module